MSYAQKNSMIIRMNYHRLFLSMTTYNFLFRLPKPPTYYMTINPPETRLKHILHKLLKGGKRLSNILKCYLIQQQFHLRR